jgi:hypothetical protein
MGEYVLVPDVMWDSDEFAHEWLRRSFEFVAAMPLKEKKQPAAKKTPKAAAKTAAKATRKPPG